MPIRRLTRSRTEGKVAGVCAGIANYFDVDVVLVPGGVGGVLDRPGRHDRRRARLHRGLAGHPGGHRRCAESRTDAA